MDETPVNLISRFADAARRGDALAIEEGASIISAALGHPAVPLTDHGADRLNASSCRLDELAAGVPRENDGTATLDGLVKHCFGMLGFVGNSRTYYDPGNSILDSVVQHRQGNPITLSVVTMAIARRVGVTLSCVGMPAHVLLRQDPSSDRAEPRWLDAFGGGLILDERGARSLFDHVTNGRMQFRPHYLDATAGSYVLFRMINNLQTIYGHIRRPEELATVAQLRATLPVDHLAGTRGIAQTLERWGRFDLAASVLDVAAAWSDATDRSELSVEASQMWSRLN